MRARRVRRDAGRVRSVLVAAVVAGALAGTAGMSVFVARSTSASLTAQTQNTANAWETGRLALSDNDSGTALFTVGAGGSASNLLPNQTVSRCITVTYQGSRTANGVKVYSTTPIAASAGVTELNDYLDVTIQEDTSLASGDPTADCTTWDGTATTVYTSTAPTGGLRAFTNAATSYATGVGSWAPSGSSPFSGATPVKAAYRISVTVKNDQAAQGRTLTGVNFTWEAQAS